MDVRAVLSAHHNHLILQFSLSYFRLSLEYNMKVKNDHRSKFSNLSNWKEEA